MMIDKIVEQALRANTNLALNAEAVEKEILHHDIMYILNEQARLGRLTLIGGTALRLCYGSNRLSEDLDFTAGLDFNPEDLMGFEDEIESFLKAKYGLEVIVRKPIESTKDTKTWKVTIEKHPNRPDLPKQKINIDVCAYPSFDIERRSIKNYYAMNSPVDGLPVPVQSIKEIMADKIVALAYRERRIMPRDVWDIVWLNQRNIDIDIPLIQKKLDVRNKFEGDFIEKLNDRAVSLKADPSVEVDFFEEMRRFVPANTAKNTLDADGYWGYVQNQIREDVEMVIREIKEPGGPGGTKKFKM